MPCVTVMPGTRPSRPTRPVARRIPVPTGAAVRPAPPGHDRVSVPGTSRMRRRRSSGEPASGGARVGPGAGPGARHRAQAVDVVTVAHTDRPPAPALEVTAQRPPAHFAHARRVDRIVALCGCGVRDGHVHAAVVVEISERSPEAVLGRCVGLQAPFRRGDDRPHGVPGLLVARSREHDDRAPVTVLAVVHLVHRAVAVHVRIQRPPVR